MPTTATSLMVRSSGPANCVDKNERAGDSTPVLFFVSCTYRFSCLGIRGIEEHPKIFEQILLELLHEIPYFWELDYSSRREPHPTESFS